MKSMILKSGTYFIKRFHAVVGQSLTRGTKQDTKKNMKHQQYIKSLEEEEPRRQRSGKAERRNQAQGGDARQPQTVQLLRAGRLRQAPHSRAVTQPLFCFSFLVRTAIVRKAATRGGAGMKAVQKSSTQSASQPQSITKAEAERERETERERERDGERERERREREREREKRSREREKEEVKEKWIKVSCGAPLRTRDPGGQFQIALRKECPSWCLWFPEQRQPVAGFLGQKLRTQNYIYWHS